MEESVGGGSEFAAELAEGARAIHAAATRHRVQEYDDERRAESGQDLPRTMEDSSEWNTIDAGYAWIDSYFDGWMGLPDPERTKPLINRLERVVGEGDVGGDQDAKNLAVKGGSLVADAFDDAEAARNAVGNSWDGTGALMFQVMLSNVNPALTNQIAIGKVLIHLATGNYRALKAAQRDLRQLQGDTVAAIEANHQSDGIDMGAVKAGLMLAGTAMAFTSGLGAIPAVAGFALANLGPTGLPDESDEDLQDRVDDARGRYNNANASLAVVGTVMGLGSYLPEEEEHKDKGPRLAGDTTDEVLGNMVNAATKIQEEYDEAMRGLVSLCEKNLDFIRDNDMNGALEFERDPYTPVIVAPRPKQLVDVPPDRVDENFRPAGTPI